MLLRESAASPEVDYNMTASPSPKDGDREAEAEQIHSGDEDGPMNPPRTGIHGQHLLPYEFEVKEQDRWLPIANVARIMKLALPENAKIAKEAKECMQECVSEFISFITSEASEKCQQEKRKTVNGEDILFAMTSLGFENYAEALKIYLTKYRESQTARGDNQNRAGSAFPGADSTGTTSVPDQTTSSSAGPYRDRSDSVNDMLSPSGPDVAEHDPGGYGYPSVVGSAHNGAGGPSF